MSKSPECEEFAAFSRFPLIQFHETAGLRSASKYPEKNEDLGTSDQICVFEMVRHRLSMRLVRSSRRFAIAMQHSLHILLDDHPSTIAFIMRKNRTIVW
jgi:hypothetical protein